MENRRQRLALGPVSDHGDEIAQALEIFQAKQDAQVCLGGEIRDFPEPKAQQQINSSTMSAFIPKQRYNEFKPHVDSQNLNCHSKSV